MSIHFFCHGPLKVELKRVILNNGLNIISKFTKDVWLFDSSILIIELK